MKEKFWMKCNGEHLEEVARRKKLVNREKSLKNKGYNNFTLSR